jgi:Fe-S cluster biosynthesis and repair protein YggX
MRTVKCVKLNQELEGMDRIPYPGEFGQRLYDAVSKPAWRAWLDHQTMLLNERRLNMLDPDARKYLKTQCENFFFGEAVDQPEGYTPRI